MTCVDSTPFCVALGLWVKATLAPPLGGVFIWNLNTEEEMSKIFQGESGHDEVLIVNENDDGDEEAVSVGATTTQSIEDNATTPLTTPKIKPITKNCQPPPIKRKSNVASSDVY